MSTPDVIIYHPKASWCPYMADMLNIPCILAIPLPIHVPTKEYPCFLFPNWKLGGWYNKMTHQFILTSSPSSLRDSCSNERRRASRYTPTRIPRSCDCEVASITLYCSPLRGLVLWCGGAVVLWCSSAVVQSGAVVDRIGALRRLPHCGAVVLDPEAAQARLSHTRSSRSGVRAGLTRRMRGGPRKRIYDAIIQGHRKELESEFIAKVGELMGGVVVEENPL